MTAATTTPARPSLHAALSAGLRIALAVGRFLVGVGTGLLLGVVVPLLVWELPAALVPPHGLVPKDLLDAQNDVRAILVQGLIGIAAGATLYFTWRRIAAAEKTVLLTQRTVSLAQETQITDRFAKAVEQLAGPSTEVRLGGIYSLERLAKDSAEAPEGPGRDYWTIMELFAAFVRHRAPWREGAPLPDDPLIDVQAVLTVLGRRPRYDGKNEKGETLDLNLRKTDLRKTDLRGAHLERAHLWDAHLEGAVLIGAHLNDARLLGAHLERADLRNTSLHGARLNDAHLEGADLRETLGLTLQQIGVAHIDAATKLPPEIRAALNATRLTDSPTPQSTP